MRLIYVADPMCSWCYGFGPQLADLRARLADTLGAPVPVTLITGGLRPSQREPLAADKRDEILHHWHAVAERSGMPFDQSPGVAMRSEGFVYDTEPACRAVVMAREHWGEADERVLACFHAIQHAFYAEGRDTTRAEVLREITIASGLAADHVDAVFNPMRCATKRGKTSACRAAGGSPASPVCSPHRATRCTRSDAATRRRWRCTRAPWKCWRSTPRPTPASRFAPRQRRGGGRPLS
ncbi:hypothetical protein ACEQUB_00754 [Ralstonia syzygii]